MVLSVLIYWRGRPPSRKFSVPAVPDAVAAAAAITVTAADATIAVADTMARATYTTGTTTTVALGKSTSVKDALPIKNYKFLRCSR